MSASGVVSPVGVWRVGWWVGGSTVFLAEGKGRFEDVMLLLVVLVAVDGFLVRGLAGGAL